MKTEELYKILLSDKPSVELLNKEKELFELIPELEKCKDFNQNNDWHIYDVYTHTLCVINYIPNKLALRLAALFHDTGKPISYKEDENCTGHFYGHWIESQKIFNNFASKNNVEKKLANLVSNLIYYHDINIGKFNNEQIQKLYTIFTKDEIKMLYELKKADLLAQNEKYHYILDDYDKQERKLLKKGKNYNGR